jgi:hypothetical protein
MTETQKQKSKQSAKRHKITKSKRVEPKRVRGLAGHWRQWSLIKKIAVVIALITVVALGLFVAFLLLLAAGYPDSIVRPINPNSPRIVKAREKARTETEQEEKALTHGTQLKFYTKDTANSCYKGQSSYKSSDDFTSRCSFYTVYYYGLNGEYETSLRSIEQHLKDSAWKKPKYEGDTITMDMEAYQRFLKEEPTTPNSYTPDIVSGAYTKDSSQFSIKINSKQDKFPDLLRLGNEADAKKIFEDIAKDNDYAVSIMIVDFYASKPSLRDGLF